jgi:hypothetical protein
MAARRVTPRSSPAPQLTTNPVAHLVKLAGWLFLNGLSCAGRAIYCLPETEPPFDRPEWWRGEARAGVADIDDYLAAAAAPGATRPRPETPADPRRPVAKWLAGLRRTQASLRPPP